MNGIVINALEKFLEEKLLEVVEDIINYNLLINQNKNIKYFLLKFYL